MAYESYLSCNAGVIHSDRQCSLKHGPQRAASFIFTCMAAYKQQVGERRWSDGELVRWFATYKVNERTGPPRSDITNDNVVWHQQHITCVALFSVLRRQRCIRDDNALGKGITVRDVSS